MIAEDINLHSKQIIMIFNINMSENLPFCNYNLAIDWTEYQFNSDGDNSYSSDKSV